MAVQIGDQQLELADDFAQALDRLADRAATNTRRALVIALRRTLRDLRRWYSQAVDPELPAERSADGQLRRPGSYSIAESSRKLQDLQRIAQAYFSTAELRALEQRYATDLEQATSLGDDLAQQLLQTADPQAIARSQFVGPSRAAIRAAAATTSAYIRAEVESFRDNLTRVVTQGVARGHGYRKIERDVRIALLGARDPNGLTQRMGLANRAELIARSELSNAYVGAQKATAEQNGLKYGRWIATKDERTCPVCASRHGRIYLLSEMVGTQHPRCVLGDTPVSPGPIAAAFRSWYNGEVVTVGLEGGSKFTVTAEHPVLTGAGIRHANLLSNGDDLVSYSVQVQAQTAFVPSPDLHEAPAAAEDVFAALAESSAVTTVRMPCAPLDLHGDGRSIQGDIDVVRADCLLEGYWEAAEDERFAKPNSIGRRVAFRPFTSFRHADLAVLGLGAAACGNVRRFGEALSLLRGGLGHAEEHRIAAAAWGDPGLLEPAGDHGPAHAEMERELFDAFPGVVQRQKVISIEVNHYQGYVYTFETFCGFYSTGFSDRFINQNCRCSIAPVANEAVEESDPKRRATLLREAYWERSREQVAREFAGGKGWPFERASKVLEEHLRKPSPSEKRQYPGIETAAQPVV